MTVQKMQHQWSKIINFWEFFWVLDQVAHTIFVVFFLLVKISIVIAKWIKYCNNNGGWEQFQIDRSV